MRIVLVVCALLFASNASAANYVVGSSAEEEALKYKPDWLEIYFREFMQALEKNNLYKYEIRLQDAHPDDEKEETPP